MTYRVDRGQPEVAQAGLGQDEQLGESQKLEDYEVILGGMQFEQMCEEVNTRAPMLHGLLGGLMAPKTERKDRAPRDPSKFYHRIAMITSILCYSRASEGSNKFPRAFGAFLHSNGVKRRILDLFHRFRFCEGYKGVHKHLETVAEQAKASSGQGFQRRRHPSRWIEEVNAAPRGPTYNRGSSILSWCSSIRRDGRQD